MKLLNKIIIGVVALLLVALASFAVYESKFVDITRGFFEAIEQKDVEATRSFLPNNGNSPEYAALFNELVPQGAALNFKADGMFSQTGLFSAQDKTISGTINPEAVQKPIPVTVLFVAENNTWKIKEVREDVEKSKPAATAAEEQEKTKMMATARQAMADFVLSKKAKSMEHFYSTISEAWKKGTTVKDLDKSFAPILDDPTDWSFLNPVEPNITKYAVAKDGVLTIIGVYPTKPKRLIFEQNFVIENNVWKLAGFKLYTADAESPATGDKPSSSDGKEVTGVKKGSIAPDNKTKK